MSEQIERITDTQADWETGTLEKVRAINAEGKLQLENNPVLFFDGIDDYVDCGNDSSLNLTDAMTVVVDMCPRSWGGGDFGRIISKDYATGYDLFIDGGNKGLGTYFGGTLYHSSSNCLELDKKQQAILTFDRTLPSAQIKFYVDAVFVGSATRTTAIPTNTEKLYIGNREALDRAFYGSIDGIWIYNRVLSDTEINDFYHYGTIPTAGMVAGWPMNEKSGSVVYDQSGNENHGTIHGAVWKDQFRSWHNPDGEGYRISPPLDLSAIQEVENSLIEFVTEGCSQHPSATWNPDDMDSGITLYDENMRARLRSDSSPITKGVRATEGISSGVWYWEAELTERGPYSYPRIGISSLGASRCPGADTGSRGYHYNGRKFPGDLPYGASYGAGDTIGVKLDMNLGTIEFFKNGISQGVAFDDLLDIGATVYPAVGSTGSGTYSNYSSWVLNIGPFDSVSVSCAISDNDQTPPDEEEFLLATSGEPIPGIVPGMNWEGKYLWTKQELKTEIDSLSPHISYLRELITSAVEPGVIIGRLTMYATAGILGRGQNEIYAKQIFHAPVQMVPRAHNLIIAGMEPMCAATQLISHAHNLIIARPEVLHATAQLAGYLVRVRTSRAAWHAAIGMNLRGQNIASGRLNLCATARLRIAGLVLVIHVGAYEVTEDDYFRKDQPAKSEELANIIEVMTQPLRPVDAAVEVYRSEDPVTIDPDEEQVITAFYSEQPVIEVVASLEGNDPATIIIDEKKYAWGAQITVKNAGAIQDEFELVIEGKPLEVRGSQLVTAQNALSIREHGPLKFKFPENHLVQTCAMAQRIADTLRDSFSIQRRDLSLDWRGNPAVTLADILFLPEYKKHGEHVYGHFHITRQNIQYDGGLRTNTEGRKMENE